MLNLQPNSPIVSNTLKRDSLVNPRLRPLVVKVVSSARLSLSSLEKNSVLSVQIENLKNQNEILKKTHVSTLLNQRNLQPISESKIEELMKDKKEEFVILWRGCSPDQLLGIAEKGSAGGHQVDNKSSTPTEKSAKDQVGEKDRLPEFTTSTSVAMGFGTGSLVGAFRISTKYLTRGSIPESGWVCSPSAPVEIVGWDKGRQFMPITSPSSSPLTPRTGSITPVRLAHSADLSRNSLTGRSVSAITIPSEKTQKKN